MMSGKVYKLLFLFLTWIVYITIGVFIFKAVEGDSEIDTETSNTEHLERLKKDVTTKYNMSEDEFENIARQIQQAGDSSSAGPEWSYENALSFIIQLLTTIGYGNITPVTSAGRILCIFYALFGIPINILFLQVVGELMLNGQQILITRFEKGCLKIDGKPKFLNEKCTFLGVLLLLTLLLVGAGIQMSIQEWTFLEGFYAYFITFTTVGFGDLIPGHESGNKAHMAYRVILIILGLAAMSNVINSIVKCEDSAKLFKKLKERFRRTRSVEVSKQNENGGEEMIEKAPKV